jgi:hypothetical protein
MGMAVVREDDVDTSTTWDFNQPIEPLLPWVPASGQCPSEPVYRRKPCLGEPGHPKPHWDGHGTVWWPDSCVDCGGNYESGVEVAGYKPHRYRCVSPIGCRRRQRRARTPV